MHIFNLLSPSVNLDINVENVDEILNFVNTWGLLGLLRVNKYSEAAVLPGKILAVALEREQFSRCNFIK
jgi:hypothetical protein